MEQHTNHPKSCNETSESFSDNAAVQMVFGNPLIFEIILEFLIFDKDVKGSRKNIKTVRLVEHHWLDTMSTKLKKFKLHLVVLEISSHKHSIQRWKNIERLKQIVSTLTSPERLLHSVLPFRLILPAKFFREENHQTLLKCLTLLGNEMLELQVSFPSDGGTMSLQFPELSLPLLNKISFEFSCENSQGSYRPQFTRTNEDGVSLLQKILDASENLREIVFPQSRLAKLPDQFTTCQLPNSVVSVKIEDAFRKEYLNLLFANKLPNLKHLILGMTKLSTRSCEGDIMHKILEHFQLSIQTLFLHSTSKCLEAKMILDFPKLEKLEKIQIVGPECELSPKNSSYLQNILPNLHYVALNRQTEDELAKWIQNSKFELVKSLSLGILVNEVYDHVKSVNFEMMAQVHAAFPNLRQLEISVDIDDVTGLIGVFQNMIQLKSLKINIRESFSNYLAREWICESILMGLPVWLISAHAENSEYFQSFVSKRRKPSLVNLTELTSFTFAIQQYKPTMPGYKLALSDMLFGQTFFTLPKLRSITFSANVQPMENMERKWKDEGRLIQYIAVEDGQNLDIFKCSH